MNTPDALAELLASIVGTSDAIYDANGGEPLPTSIAASEVAEHDSELATTTGTPRPVFGAYADAEAKLRVLNDLVRSLALILANSTVNVGHVPVGRAAIETAGRTYWGLAISRDYEERAARWLREQLRGIEEVSKFGAEARKEIERLGLTRQIKDGALRAGLKVPGPSPSAIDLVWPLLTAPESPLRIDGLEREEMMLLFYRSPSATIHGAPHGLVPHLADPRRTPSMRATQPEPFEQTLVFVSGVFNGYTNAHRALIVLYGWDRPGWDKAAGDAARQLAAALEAERSHRA